LGEESSFDLGLKVKRDRHGGVNGLAHGIHIDLLAGTA
jgi:hypothetical protein